MPQLLSELVKDVLVRGPYDAPQAVAEDAVRRTAIDLCEQTGIWTYEFEFAEQQGVSDYPLIIPEMARVVAMNWVRIGTHTYYPYPNTCRCRCGAFEISMPDNTTIVLSPPPMPGCEMVPVTVQLWLTLTQNACELPDFLYEEYSDVIADGAASRLLQMPKQSFTNQGLAQKLYAMYVIGKTRAKNKRVQQRTTGPLLMRGSYFDLAAICALTALIANYLC